MTNLALDVSPYLLVQVQMWRIRREVEQLELTVKPVHKLLHPPGLVNRMTIHNHEDLPV